jgi:hypothetical protein
MTRAALLALAACADPSIADEQVLTIARCGDAAVTSGNRSSRPAPPHRTR